MRFLKVTTFYTAYLRQFYRRHPLLGLERYAEQRRKLFFDAFGWADFFESALAPQGYEAQDLVINAEPLQRAWATEHGVPFPTGEWMLEVAFQQVRRTDPEILFLDDTSTFPADWIQRVRRACSSLRLVLGWSGAPSSHQGALGAYDAVLSCVPEIVRELQAAGVKAFHLHHGFDPQVLARIDARRPPTQDLTFVGQMVQDSRFHEERQRILLNLSERFDVRIYSPTFEYGLQVRVKNLAKPLLKPVAAALDQAPLPSWLRRLIPLPPADSASYRRPPSFPKPIARRLHGAVFGLEMFQTLHDSRVTFNSHIGASRRSASNQRLFEATGAGTCLLTDDKDNLHELFVPDEEVVIYRSVEECLDKAGWLLENSARAAEIARRGQARTLRDHTFAHRAESLHRIIQAL